MVQNMVEYPQVVVISWASSKTFVVSQRDLQTKRDDGSIRAMRHPQTETDFRCCMNGERRLCLSELQRNSEMDIMKPTWVARGVEPCYRVHR